MTDPFTQAAKPKAAKQSKAITPEKHETVLAQDEQDRVSTRKLREDMAKQTFWFMCSTTGFIGGLLSTYFVQHICKGEMIPSSVIITMITTTFATIVGLVVLILKGLFGTK